MRMELYPCSSVPLVDKLVPGESVRIGQRIGSSEVLHCSEDGLRTIAQKSLQDMTTNGSGASVLKTPMTTQVLPVKLKLNTKRVSYLRPTLGHSTPKLKIERCQRRMSLIAAEPDPLKHEERLPRNLLS